MKNIKSVFILLVILTSSVVSYSQGKIYTNDQNVALNGYDVVAYFNQHEAVRGSNENAVALKGTTYYFSTAANALLFKANPNNYLPAFGGYCATAMAMKGAQVPSNPQTFKIRDGKLYIFFNDYYEGKPFNTIIPWNNNEAEMVATANSNWKKLK